MLWYSTCTRLPHEGQHIMITRVAKYEKPSWTLSLAKFLQWHQQQNTLALLLQCDIESTPIGVGIVSRIALICNFYVLITKSYLTKYLLIMRLEIIRREPDICFNYDEKKIYHFPEVYGHFSAILQYGPNKQRYPGRPTAFPPVHTLI